VDYNGPRATPTVSDDKVYTYTQHGHLHCFAKDTGVALWDKRVSIGRPHWGFSGSPLIKGDLVILNAGGAGTAVNKEAPHDIVWSNSGYARYASPIPLTWNSQSMVAVVGKDGLFGVNTRTGKILCSFPWASDYNIADPVVHGDKVFFCNGTDHICSLLQLGKGELRVLWQNSNIASEWSSPVLIGDYLYAFGGSDELICLDMRDGTVRWSAEGMGLTEGGLIAAGGKLIVLGEHGKLAVIKASPEGCDMEGRATVDVVPDAEQETWWTPPVLCDGRIYCRSHEGTLVCLDVGVRSDKAER
jgi:outer membrane protein assembly factor BamB